MRRYRLVTDALTIVSFTLLILIMASWLTVAYNGWADSVGTTPQHSPISFTIPESWNTILAMTTAGLLMLAIIGAFIIGSVRRLAIIAMVSLVSVLLFRQLLTETLWHMLLLTGFTATALIVGLRVFDTKLGPSPAEV